MQLWDTVIVASEQTTSAVTGLRVMDTLIASGAEAPDPHRVSSALDLLAQKITIEEAADLFEELRPGGPPQVAVAMRLLEHALDLQDADALA